GRHHARRLGALHELSAARSACGSFRRGPLSPLRRPVRRRRALGEHRALRARARSEASRPASLGSLDDGSPLPGPDHARDPAVPPRSRRGRRRPPSVLGGGARRSGEARMSRVFSILGTGRQGLAAAYDLGLRAEPGEIRLLDADLGVVTGAAERLLRLLSESSPGTAHPIPAIRPVKIDAREAKPLAAALAGSTAVLCALPADAARGAARAALAVRAHYCDLGGGGLDDPAVLGEARTSGVSIIPDCGL